MSDDPHVRRPTRDPTRATTVRDARDANQSRAREIAHTGPLRPPPDPLTSAHAPGHASSNTHLKYHPSRATAIAATTKDTRWGDRHSARRDRQCMRAFACGVASTTPYKTPRVWVYRRIEYGGNRHGWSRSDTWDIFAVVFLCFFFACLRAVVSCLVSALIRARVRRCSSTRASKTHGIRRDIFARYARDEIRAVAIAVARVGAGEGHAIRRAACDAFARRGARMSF